MRAQIGLVDLLREEYGIKPAGILGHSAGGALNPCAMGIHSNLHLDKHRLA